MWLFKKTEPKHLFIDCADRNDNMDNYILQIFNKLSQHTKLINGGLSYNKLTKEIFSDPMMALMSCAKVGASSTMGFYYEHLEKLIKSNYDAYLCYIAIPVNTKGNALDNHKDMDKLANCLESLVGTHVSSIGATAFGTFEKCKTLKWLYQDKNI